jgi:hypothetical protein
VEKENWIHTLLGAARDSRMENGNPGNASPVALSG